MERLTRWVLRHRLIVVVFWLLSLGGGMASAAGITDVLSQEFAVPDKPAFAANEAIVADYGNGGEMPPVVLVTTVPEGAKISDAATTAELQGVLDSVLKSAPNLRVIGYPDTLDPRFISEDGRTTFAYVYGPAAGGFSEAPVALPAIEAVVADATVAGAPIALTGIPMLTGDGGGGGEGPSLLIEVLFGGLGALAVLIFVFASFLALTPLMVALVAIPSTFLVLGILARLTDVSIIVQFLVGLIGLGVAIDYALLIVTRWREERALGAEGDEALVRAMKTAGRAVVVSGITVAIGLLALVILPVPFLRSIGYAGMLIPTISVLVSITLLPVVLATIGPRLEWPRIRKEDTASRGWTRWAELVVRRRWIAAIVGIAILAILLVPASQIVIGEPAATSLTSSGPPRDALLVLQDSGIGDGAVTPMEVIATTATAAATAQSLAAVEGVRLAVTPTAAGWQAEGTTLIEVIPQNDGATPEGRATIDRVRAAAEQLEPAPQVGGVGPQNDDFISAVYGSFPLMLLMIGIITFIFLAREFRSLLLPLKAIILNLCSVGAAWGIMVWAWQQGNLSEPVWGIEATGAITSWLPLMVFAFLYGLSMDYEVFILARMREEYDATGSNTKAIVTGIGRTGRLVTSAALVLFLAFVALGATPETAVRIFATGLAAGILLDATLIRALLVPALVSLFGNWNWWMPVWAAKILRVEPSLPNRNPG